ncbi:hypothetical protein GYMLUDRAFT_78437 [Collybiopsis luxurians FD-317 M1]|uniref:Uncharacterized protein n=1 Tax=Collybiopsis luxurians FD-317 M1 TaxID=944289 RepID=A0A0D0BZ31_9AGAR|nr:hypothetical protein GYMLUDRAFT_78437 [Collybiopsis luxurians FD-317 M1]
MARTEQNKEIHVQWKEDCQLWDENRKNGISQGPQPKWHEMWFPPVPKTWLASKPGSESKANYNDDEFLDE